jgi:hypothetical protein
MLSTLVVVLDLIMVSFLLALTALKRAHDFACLGNAQLDSHDTKHPFETGRPAEERGDARSSKNLNDALGLSLSRNNSDFRVLIHDSSLHRSPDHP